MIGRSGLFLKKIMRMGFEKWIRMCVTTVSYKIKVNGEYAKLFGLEEAYDKETLLNPHICSSIVLMP